MDERERVLNRFQSLNNKESKHEANGMIAVFIEQGAKETLLREVFGIGYERYRKILHNQNDKVSGGRNRNAVSQDMIEQLHRFTMVGVPTELGYPCGHRRMLKYCTDPAVTSWEKLYEMHFLKFEDDNKLVRKMGKITFYNFMSAYHPEFRLKRVMEDACDTCIELQTMLKDKRFSEDEHQSIGEALANHGEMARNMRNVMRNAIVLWKGNHGTLDSELEGAADRLEAVLVDDPAPDNKWQPSKVEKVQLVCEDFAGNFTSPWYGRVRPGADYYASKLAMYCFIIADISRNINYVKLYDERAMGKDANALCSLRFVHHLTQYNSTPMDSRPTILFQVLDNNVGQNKSQVVFMYFALLSMTLYPEGVVLLFLFAGHSHMAPDRTVSWLRKSLNNRQVYLPGQFVEAFNTISSVEAEFIDHTDSNRMCFERWEEILKAHFAPIPTIKDGGYTQFHFFEFKNGVLTMRHNPESIVAHTHVYVQRASYSHQQGSSTDQSYALLVQQCLTSVERHLFYPGKSFANATAQDINVTSTAGLIRHHRKEVLESRVKSFWTKGFSIPFEYQSYYPPCPISLHQDDSETPAENSEPASKKIRKSHFLDPMKLVKKNLMKPSTAASIPNSSIARFFVPSPKVSNNPQQSIVTAKVSKQSMIWHLKSLTPTTTSPPPPVEQVTLQAENNRAEKVYDLLENGGEADYLAVTEESSALVREQKRTADQFLLPPPLSRGHVVLTINGNKATTGPSPSRYRGVQAPIDALLKMTAASTTTSSASSSAVEQENIPRPLIGCCNFCGTTTRHCKLIYSGCNMSSSVSKSLRYSFPWRKNSCAIDSIGACLQMIYCSNLNREGKDIMEQHCPDLCELFDKLSGGSIATFKAKEALETLLGDRLWTSQNSFWKFRQHLFESVEVAFQLFQIRPPSPLPDMRTNNVTDVSMFTSSVTITELCPTMCNEGNPYSRPFSFDMLDDQLFSMDCSLPTLTRCMVATIAPNHCHKCKKYFRTEYNPFKGAIMIGIRNTFNSKNSSLFQSVPDQIQLGDSNYTLSACIYGDGGHFITLVRDFPTNRLFLCDGMANNAQFVEVKSTTTTTFPDKFSKKTMNIAYFLRSDYITVPADGGGKGKEGY